METISLNQRRISLLADIVLIIASFYITYALSYSLSGHHSFAFDSTAYYGTRRLVTLSWIMALMLTVEYPVRRLTVFTKEVWIVLQVSAVGIVVFTSLSFIFKLHDFSRLFLALFLVVTSLLMIALRLILRVVLGVIRRSGADMKTRIVVGDELSAARYVAATSEHPESGIRVIGSIGDEPLMHNLNLLGTVEEFVDVLKTHPADGVVVTWPVSDPRTEAVIRVCETIGVPVELVLDSLGSKLANSSIVHSMGIPRMVVSQEPYSPRGLLWKRITDLSCSITLLAVLSPLFLVIAAAIKLNDGGPVFFSQARSGKHGKTFQMCKFRSMRVDAEEIREQLMHLNQMSGPVFKIKDDPRVTKVGKWLRRTSLDELPQLFNVLLGHMSLVGPRPPLPAEVNEYDPQHVRRLSVKPGITCLWQIGGRNEIDFEEWMALDLRYIDNWSYWTDWKILFQTLPAVLKRKGAS